MTTALTVRSERVVCLYFGGARRAATLIPLAEACFRFTPQVALRANEAIFLEVASSLALFKLSEPGLAARIRALSERFGLQPRITFAGDAGTALALARFGIAVPAGPDEMKRVPPQCVPPQRVPIDALDDFADPFVFDSDRARRMDRAVSLLRMLGVENLKGFIELPRETLASRFGPEILELRLRIAALAEPLNEGRAPARPWPRFRPSEKVLETVELGDAETLSSCASLEPLLHALRPALDRCMARLKGKSERASRIELVCRLENREARKWSMELSSPQGTVHGLVPILRERLAYDLQMQPLESPVESLEFEILETAPGHGAQRDFFHSREAEAEARDALLGRLTAKLGEQGAFAARLVNRHLPEAAWMPSRAPASPAELFPELPRRPTRVLKKPEPLRWDGKSLVASVLKRWRVVEWDGPERISGEWWMKFSQGAGEGSSEGRSESPKLEVKSLVASGSRAAYGKVSNAAALAAEPLEDRGFARDYYHVRTDSGEELWVFRAGRELFLHGFFD